MTRLTQSLTLIAALMLSACASIEVPRVNFMDESDFGETIDELERSYPGVDEIPAIPVNVRSAEAWDQTARDMQTLYDIPDAPEAAPSLSDEAFEQEFQNAIAAVQRYKADDPS